MGDYLFWNLMSWAHDWKDYRLIESVIETARAHGLIGDGEWIEPKVNARRERFRVPAAELAGKFARYVKGKASTWVTIGGTRPQEWAFHVGLSPWDKEEGRVSSANFAELHAARAAFRGESASDRLWAAFRSVHARGATLTGCIHPDPHYERLCALGYLGSPWVTIGRLKGAMWASYLAPGFPKKLDRERLGPVDAHHVEWTSEGGLFLRACRDVDQVESPEVEARLLRITEHLRRAWG